MTLDEGFQQAATFESVYDLRLKVAAWIEQGVIDVNVLDHVIRLGRGIRDECILWDFKASLPVFSSLGKDQYAAKMHEIVKDAVAFYNSFGGYIIAGVDDQSREVIGFREDFDVEDLNKKVSGVTESSVECLFRQLPCHTDGQNVAVGVLFIPKRPATVLPLQFRRDAPLNTANQRAYRQGEFYIRERDACCPARTPAQYEFLFSERQRSLLGYTSRKMQFLQHNLPERDAELGRLVGRDAEQASLWEWLADQVSHIKLICGLGGVGKTALAYTFCEKFVYAAPQQFDKLIWLGAKVNTFTAIKDRLRRTARVDFSDIDSFMKSMLLEIGCPPTELSEEASQEKLQKLCIDHLSTYKYFIVVDDLDTLPDETQQEILFLIHSIAAISQSKVLLTARRNLGLPRSRYIELSGLNIDEFKDFVEQSANIMKIPNPCSSEPSLVNFHDVTGGSPLFAISVLRLVSLGERFQTRCGIGGVPTGIKCVRPHSRVRSVV